MVRRELKLDEDDRKRVTLKETKYGFVWKIIECHKRGILPILLLLPRR